MTARQHRIAKRFTDPKEREWAAATLQVLCRHLRDTETHVVIGEPISSGQSSQRVAIRAAMASLLARLDTPHGEDLTTSTQIFHELATKT
jgi:ribosomal protein L18E